MIRRIFPAGRMVSVAAATLVCTACATVTIGEYETVVLDEAFESGASRVDVRAPGSRNRDSFYNIAMGDYQAKNTSVGKTTTVKADRSGGPERTVTEDDTLWNLVLKGELTAENVTYDQYRVDDHSKFSFSIVDLSGKQIDSSCVRHSIFLENEETSRLGIGLGDISEENSVERYGEWLASDLSCTIQGAGEIWELRSTTSQESRPSIALSREGVSLNTRVLDMSLAYEAGVGGRVPADNFGMVVDDQIAGLYIGQDGDQLAAVSTARGNSAIWLGSTADSVERTFIMAAGYSVLLNEWLTE